MAAGYVDTYRLRYIVPFYYIADGKTFFDDICADITARPDWKVKDVRGLAMDTDPENAEDIDQDFYSYMTDLYRQFDPERDRENRKNNIACAWDYVPEGRTVKRLCLKMGGSSDDLQMDKAGIFLFRSGIGLFWYEMSVCGRNNRNPLTVSELIRFQNRLKELNQKKRGIEWYEVAECIYRTCDAGIFEQETMVQGVSDQYTQFEQREKGRIAETRYIRNSYLEATEQERLYMADCEPVVMRDHACIYPGRDEEKREFWMIKWHALRSFNMGEWIAALLQNLIPSAELHYLPDKKNYLWREDEGHCKYVPDKAVFLAMFYWTARMQSRII